VGNVNVSVIDVVGLGLSVAVTYGLGAQDVNSSAIAANNVVKKGRAFIMMSFPSVVQALTLLQTIKQAISLARAGLIWACVRFFHTGSTKETK
jgi:hypothetical protein